MMKLKMAYAAAALIFLLAVIGTVWVFSPAKSKIAEVIRDGEVLYRFDLTSAKDSKIRIEYGDSYNIVEISNGEIFVSEAGCADNTCVKTGKLSSGAPVVCLPNHLVIRFSEESGTQIDAVAQ